MQRLQELLESFRVYALCVPCGRMEAVDLHQALQRLGAEATVGELRERVRCRGCGARTRDVRVIYVGPEHRRATFHYQR